MCVRAGGVGEDGGRSASEVESAGMVGWWGGEEWRAAAAAERGVAVDWKWKWLEECESGECKDHQDDGSVIRKHESARFSDRHVSGLAGWPLGEERRRGVNEERRGGVRWLVGCMAAMHVVLHLAVADLLSCFGVQCRSGVWVAEGWGVEWLAGVAGRRD